MWLLNKKLRKFKVAYKLSPGTTLRDFLHYLKLTLHKNETDTYGRLSYGRKWCFETKFQYWQCQKILWILENVLHFFVKQITISGLILFARLNASFMHNLNNTVKVLCQKYCYSFNDNSSLSSENFWENGLRLNNSGKGILLKN